MDTPARDRPMFSGGISGRQKCYGRVSKVTRAFQPTTVTSHPRLGFPSIEADGEAHLTIVDEPEVDAPACPPQSPADGQKATRDSCRYDVVRHLSLNHCLSSSPVLH